MRRHIAQVGYAAIGLVANGQILALDKPDSLQPMGSCNDPNVEIHASKNPAMVDEAVTFTATITDGTPPYTIEWDFESDLSTSQFSYLDAPQAAYPEAGTYYIGLAVRDSLNCFTYVQHQQFVDGAEFEITNVGDLVESNGNGDMSIDPGETWATQVTIKNVGNATARDVHPLFVPSAGTGLIRAKRRGGPDGFGYVFFDSNDAECSYDFIDIAATGNPLTFSTTGGAPALDDGTSGAVQLGHDFPFYGQTHSTLTMSANGYLSTDPNDVGFDHDNDCGIVSPSAGAPARLNAMHDDLVISHGYYQYFASCPRPLDGADNTGCSIFQWDDVAYFAAPGPPFFDLQAVLYDSGQIIYQKASGDIFLGSNATIGLLNHAADDGLIYACDMPDSMPDNHAVCIMTAEPLNEAIQIVNPVPAMGRFNPNQSKSVAIEMYIPADFPCGDGFGLDMAGVVAEQGLDYGYNHRISMGEVGIDGQCTSAASTQLKGNVMVNPMPGLYTDPLRSGNATDMHFYPDADILAFGMYTGRENRDIGWYQSAGQRSPFGQMCTDLIEYHWNGTWVPGIDPATEVAGRVCITQIDAGNAIDHIRFNNGRSMVGRMQFLSLSDAPTTTDYTGGWATPGQNWGDAVVTQGDIESHVLFFYDNNGDPTVAQGVVDNATGTAQMFSFKAHPPGRVWITPETFPVGTLTRTYSDANTGTVSTTIDYPAPDSATWNVSDVPMNRITVDVP